MTKIALSATASSRRIRQRFGIMLEVNGSTGIVSRSLCWEVGSFGWTPQWLGMMRSWRDKQPNLWWACRTLPGFWWNSKTLSAPHREDVEQVGNPHSRNPRSNNNLFLVVISATQRTHIWSSALQWQSWALYDTIKLSSHCMSLRDTMLHNTISGSVSGSLVGKCGPLHEVVETCATGTEGLSARIYCSSMKMPDLMGHK